MVLFTDNDILIKLAAFDLLDEAVALLGGQEICVLAAAKYRLQKPGRKTRAVHDAATIERALAFCEAASQLTEAPHPEDEAALAGADCTDENGEPCRIDGGELILFSGAFRRAPSLLVTGDKKCLYALGRHATEAPAPQVLHARTIRDSLQNRVVCLEAMVEAMCRQHGFETIRDRVSPARGCDSSMRVAFGSGALSEESRVATALSQYISHAERSLSAGWLWRG